MSVLPLIVCCVFLIQMFKVKVGRDFEKKDMELAGAVEHQLMTLFDAYHDAAEELCTDPLVAEALKKESFGKKDEVYRSLYGRPLHAVRWRDFISTMWMAPACTLRETVPTGRRCRYTGGS